MPSGRKYVYPRAAEQLMDRKRLRSADLDDQARRDIADLTRELANWIAYCKAIPQVTIAERNGVSSGAIGEIWQHENNAAKREVEDWFISIDSPSFADVERAFTLLPVYDRERLRRERDPKTNSVRLHFPKMDAERRRAYGVPDGFLTTPSRLKLLAQWADLPSGVLLIAFRMTHNKFGKEIPVYPWLQTRIARALREHDIQPAGTTVVADPGHRVTTAATTPTYEQISLFDPDAHATTWPIVSERSPAPQSSPAPHRAEQQNRHETRRDQALADLAEVREAIGELPEFFKYFGGPTRFGELYGIKATTFRDYWLRSDERKPGAANVARLERIITVFTAAVAEHGLDDIAAVRETLAMKAKESPAITRLADARRTGTKHDDAKSSDFGGGRVVSRFPDDGGLTR